MNRIDLANPRLIKMVLFLQFIPLILFPPATYKLTSQAWWLPMILVILGIVGLTQVLRKSVEAWPLYLISFSQGFNIISRLLMFMPQSTVMGTNTGKIDGLSIVFSIVSMVASTFILWYVEKPEVKQQLLR